MKRKTGECGRRKMRRDCGMREEKRKKAFQVGESSKLYQMLLGRQ